MADFFQLSDTDRRDALDVAANASGRLPHLLEKDLWIVWALQQLFDGPHAGHLVFKVGTSLSKAYAVIHRFSEDVDRSYDIRARGEVIDYHAAVSGSLQLVPALKPSPSWPPTTSSWLMMDPCSKTLSHAAKC